MVEVQFTQILNAIVVLGNNEKRKTLRRNPAGIGIVHQLKKTVFYPGFCPGTGKKKKKSQGQKTKPPGPGPGRNHVHILTIHLFFVFFNGGGPPSEPLRDLLILQFLDSVSLIGLFGNFSFRTTSAKKRQSAALFQAEGCRFFALGLKK
jgi:hypothetical protein